MGNRIEFHQDMFNAMSHEIKELTAKATAYELQLIDCLELANKWVATQPDPESDGLSDAPLGVLLTIKHGRELKKLIRLVGRGGEAKET